MKNENIIKIGQTLGGGERWQQEMAVALDISPRHIRRLAAGEAPLSPGIVRDLREIAEQRGKDIEEILFLIKKWKKHKIYARAIRLRLGRIF